MNKHLSEIVGVMPPPKKPSNATGDWDKVELQLGLKLPKDYKEFIEHYGDGIIADILYVFNPVSKSPGFNLLWRHAGLLKTQWEIEYGHSLNDMSQYYPWRLFPAKNGLLLWGVTDNGDELYWRTKSSTDSWETVIHHRSLSRWPLIKGMGFAETLLALLRRNLKELSLDPWMASSGPSFVPSLPEKKGKASRKK